MTVFVHAVLFSGHKEKTLLLGRLRCSGTQPELQVLTTQQFKPLVAPQKNPGQPTSDDLPQRPTAVL